MYNYMEQRKEIFTEEGQEMFLKIRDNVHNLLAKAGAVRLSEAITDCGGGDTLTMLACVDRLVELKEIREVTEENKVFAQHRVFVKS